MARIIYGSIITDIKGSIGGITYQKNSSGQIARLKPRKNQTNTQKQRDQQPRLKGIQREWNELTLVNKVLWNDFASVNNKIGLDGNPKILTGYQWFLTINQNRALIGDASLLVPPVFEVVSPINNIFLTYIGGEVLMNFNPSLGGANVKASVQVSFVTNSVSKFNFNMCRNILNFHIGLNDKIGIANSIGSFSWNNYYNSVFPPSLGNKSFYLVGYIRFIGINSGISSLAYTAIAKFVWDGAKYVIE